MADRLDRHLLIKYDAAVELPPIVEKKPKQTTAEILCEESSFVSNELQEILDCTVPPEEWESEGKMFRQSLSNKGGTSRLDVVNLQHNLDSLLKERQARNSGICPVRSLLYSLCFDEIIRQVAIDSPERGLLLLRIRDEVRMTIAAYHTLYENAVAYGRMNVDAEYEIKHDLMNQIKILDTEAQVSRREVENLRLTVEHTRRTLKEKREMDSKRFSEEVQFIKRANNLLKESVLTIT